MSAAAPLLSTAATGYAGALNLPEQTPGICTHGGWKADADAGPRKSDGSSAAGPNCTYVGRRIAPSSTGTVVAVGCARNVASSLRTARSANRGLEALDSSAPNVAYVLFHDVPRGGDRDGTRDELLRMAARSERVRLVLAQPLLYPGWSRTQRLALCRNVLLAEALSAAASGDGAAGAAMVALDLDCDAGTHDAMARAAAAAGAALAGAAPWAALTANSPGEYHDRWALRSAALGLDYDCQFAKQTRTLGGCADWSLRLDPRAPVFAVDSAFNGLGVYDLRQMRRAGADECRYRGSRNSMNCEHVPFHLCLRRKGLAVAVDPGMVVGCGAARLGPAWRVRSKAAVFANGTLWRAQRAGNWTGIWMPAPAVEAGAAG